MIDLTGNKYARLTVIKLDGVRNWRPYWECKCDCGNIIILQSWTLKSGGTKSCGCLKKEVTGARFKKHGMKGTKEYNTWSHVVQRCNNPKNSRYKNYGGRGIRVCDSWLNFENFFRDMGPPPDKKYSIERIDNNGDYCPGNCKWATSKEQSNNKRTSHLINAGNKEQSLQKWSEETGIQSPTIRKRLKMGWADERALLHPVAEQHSHLITFNNETKTLAQWSRILSIKECTIWRRIKKYGWSEEKALSTKPREITRWTR